MKIKLNIHKKMIWLFVIFLCADNLLWLGNEQLRSYAKELFWLLIAAMFFIYIVLQQKQYRLLDKSSYKFGRLMLFPIFMGIYSSIQSNLLHGQTLLQGVSPQRFMVVGFLLYFVLIEFGEEYGLLNNTINLILSFAKVELLLYITQFILIGKIRFLQVPISMRLGSVRMNAGALAVNFLIFHIVNKFLTEKKIQAGNIFWLILAFYYTIGIGKTRILVIASVAARVGGFLLWKKGGRRKIIAFLIILGAIIYLSQTELFSFLIDGLNNLDSSSQIRTIGREYYLSKIVQHPIFGCGYINLDNPVATRFSGYYQDIFWVDLGIYGLLFFFGIVGLLWMILWFLKLGRLSFSIAKAGDYTYWMYFIYMLVISVNATGFLWNVGDILVYNLFTALVDLKSRKVCT